MQITQKEEHDYMLELKDKDHKHEQDVLLLNLGIFGRFFGSSEHASKNITGFVCAVLLIGASVISCWVYYTKEDVSFVKSI